jgi:hypothetical protein
MIRIITNDRLQSYPFDGGLVTSLTLSSSMTKRGKKREFEEKPRSGDVGGGEGLVVVQ